MKTAPYLIALVFLASCAKPKMQVSTGSAFGTVYTVRYQYHDTLSMQPIIKAIDRSFSAYLPSSDLSKINEGDTTIVVDRHFKAVFYKAKTVWEQTGGAFEPTVWSLLNAWGFGKSFDEKKQMTPNVDSLLKLTGFEKVTLTPKGTIRKQQPNIKLDFSALGEGYCIDQIAELLQSKGIKNYLIELGGEIRTKGINTDSGKPWKVGLDRPNYDKNLEHRLMAKLYLKDLAISTSGSYRKYRTNPETGLLYSHIINPKTGFPKESNILSVSVVSKTCIEADAYATALMTMPLEEIKTFLETHKQLQAYVIYQDKDGALEVFCTAWFKKQIID